MMRATHSLSGLIVLLLFACSMQDTDNQTFNKEILNGYVQKGPFINGASITISALDKNFNQTGISYHTNVSDNSGKFEQKDFVLSSNFVEIKADGFYFNENEGELSSAPLTLNAVTDLSNDSSVNVNVLTHLEKSRIEYLVKVKKLTFVTAQTQALKEILAIFSFIKPDIAKPEDLNLISEGEDNAILFAVSVIIQGFRSTGTMSELMANIISDIREDGVLNDSTIGSTLLNDAKYIDLSKVRTNMVNRYASLGISTNIPNFEKYIRQFIDSSDFTSTKAINYPLNSQYGTNALHDSVMSVKRLTNYSLAASLPMGTHLKIILKGGLWGYFIMPSGPKNWTINTYDYLLRTQTFTATESGKDSDLIIQFDTPGTTSIEFYENNAITPTKIKSLVVEEGVENNDNPPNDTIH